LICLFGGLRLAEACQLKARDFEIVNDMPFLFVRRGRGQKIKNASSRRAVPVHRQLIDAGLLDYVTSRSGDGDGWLFPVARPTKRRKRPVERIPADEFSKWFGRYRAAVSVGIADDEHDFHSLRHTFITRLKQSVLRDIVQAIVGHKGVKTATDDYFHGYEPAVLHAALQSLDYGVVI
jgi:integrase